VTLLYPKYYEIIKSQFLVWSKINIKITICNYKVKNHVTLTGQNIFGHQTNKFIFKNGNIGNYVPLRLSKCQVTEWVTLYNMGSI